MCIMVLSFWFLGMLRHWVWRDLYLAPLSKVIHIDGFHFKNIMMLNTISRCLKHPKTLNQWLLLIMVRVPIAAGIFILTLPLIEDQILPQHQWMGIILIIVMLGTVFIIGYPASLYVAAGVFVLGYLAYAMSQDSDRRRHRHRHRCGCHHDCCCGSRRDSGW